MIDYPHNLTCNKHLLNLSTHLHFTNKSEYINDNYFFENKLGRNFEVTKTNCLNSSSSKEFVKLCYLKIKNITKGSGISPSIITMEIPPLLHLHSLNKIYISYINFTVQKHKNNYFPMILFCREHQDLQRIARF